MRTPAFTVRDSFVPPVAVAGREEISGQLSPKRRMEFEDLLSRNLPRFQRMAMRWLRNPEDAEDAVQDAMLSAFKHITRFEGRAQMSTWLMTIVLNAVRMQLRRRSRVKLIPLDQPLKDDRYTISDLVADSRPTPEQIVEECELRKLVAKLANSLIPTQRIAMQLHKGQGLSIREAAGSLGVPEGTLKAQLARGRVVLQQRFRKALGGTRTRALRANSEAKRNRASGSSFREGCPSSILRNPQERKPNISREVAVEVPSVPA